MTNFRFVGLVRDLMAELQRQVAMESALNESINETK